MRVKLRVTQGAQAGREVIIPVSEFLIGRGEECHLRPRSDAISRRHCAIIVSEKQVVVHDLGSKNGSYVNGQRVEGKCVVQSGDQFLVGPLEFEFVIEHALGGAKRPAARDVKEVAARTAASSNEDLDIATGSKKAMIRTLRARSRRRKRANFVSMIRVTWRSKPTSAVSLEVTRRSPMRRATRRISRQAMRRPRMKWRRTKKRKRNSAIAGRRANLANCHLDHRLLPRILGKPLRIC